ncbi:MAG: ANTAR domain-containing protein [Planctomycetes bacterium]|nr:ANTAR domain-containing protein [Planctomycetota bacterium]
MDGGAPAPAEETCGTDDVPQVFLLRLEADQEENALESALTELAGRPVPPIAFLGQRVPALARIKGRRNVTVPFLVVADRVPPHDARLAEWLGLGVGVVAVTTDPGAGGWVELARQYPVIFAPPRADAEGLRFALASAAASVRRLGAARGQVRELQQRLEDRILVERAKGFLAQRLKIPEGQAYQRIRSLARRQRRPMRDVARAVLDTQALLDPSADVPDIGEGME